MIEIGGVDEPAVGIALEITTELVELVGVIEGFLVCMNKHPTNPIDS
jgi:hypothetical protein